MYTVLVFVSNDSSSMGGSFSISSSSQSLSLSVIYTVAAGGFFGGLPGPRFGFFLGGSADGVHRIGRGSSTRLKKLVSFVEAGSVAELL